MLDHVNLDKTDNRITNLRLADSSTNAMNTTANVCNKLGIKGISAIKGTSRYRAVIHIRGKQYNKYSKDINVLTEWLAVMRDKLHKDFQHA
jgi:hypothetical protein